MTSAEPKRSYPYMSIPAWASVRKAIVRSPPRNFNRDYLQSVLGITEKTAQNILPQFKNMAVIDGDGQLTQLGHDLRSDEHYPAACKQIIEATYPQGLLDAFPEPEGRVADIEQWFIRNASAGEAGARVQTRFFLMLNSGEIPEPEPVKQRSAKNGRATTAKPSPTKSVAPAPHTTKREETSEQKPPAGTGNQKDVSVQINLQIHIAPESSADQIDTIFASIAKHLNG